MSEFYRVDTGANGSVFVRNTSALNYVIAHSEGAGSTSITGGSVGISNTSPVAKFEVHDTAGELLSINNDLTSTVFSANDVSGLPMIEATANGNVIINRFRQGNLDVRGGILGESDSYTKLLIHSDTNDGNTCFIDSSSSEHTLTAVGDPQHLTAQKKFGSTSMCFDGGDDTISFPVENVTTDFDFGTGAFTIDTWINFSDVTSTGWQTILGMGYSNGITVYWNDNNLVYVYLEGVGTTYAWTPTIDTWYHLAVVRSGTDLKVYVNGVQIGTTITSSNDIIPNVTTAYIGAQSISGPTLYFRGYLDEFRISKGIARWTSDFLPPARPYSTVTSESFEEQDRLTTALTATNAGNVGIGEGSFGPDDPTRRLTVKNNSDIAMIGVWANTSETDGNMAGIGFDVGSGQKYKGSIAFRSDGSGYSKGDFIFALDNANDNNIVSASDEIMRITHEGNVGIGETSPGSLLHVRATDTGIAPHGSAQITLERDGTNYLQFLTGNDQTSGLLFGDEDDVDVAKIAYDHNIKKMQFYTETDIAMTIDENQNVGIGTTTPDFKLDVSCSTRIYGRTDIGAADNVNSGYLQMGESSSAHAKIDYDGYNGNTIFTIANNYQHDNSILRFRIGTTDRMTIKGTGNVGIGTASPQVKHHIYESTANTTVAQRFSVNYSTGTVYSGIQFAPSETGTIFGSVYYNHQANKLQFSNSSSGGEFGSNIRMIIDGSGNVGIGTATPNYTEANRTTLDINGTNESVIGFSSGGTGKAYIYNSGSRFDLWSSNDIVLQYDGVKNVGIGTTSPGSKLVVGGCLTASYPAGNGTVSGAAADFDGGDIYTGRAFFQGYQKQSGDLIGINRESDNLIFYNYTDSCPLLRLYESGKVAIAGEFRTACHYFTGTGDALYYLGQYDVREQITFCIKEWGANGYGGIEYKMSSGYNPPTNSTPRIYTHGDTKSYPHLNQKFSFYWCNQSGTAYHVWVCVAGFGSTTREIRTIVHHGYDSSPFASAPSATSLTAMTKYTTAVIEGQAGTANYLPYWGSCNTLSASSPIWANASCVGIGTATPAISGGYGGISPIFQVKGAQPSISIWGTTNEQIWTFSHNWYGSSPVCPTLTLGDCNQYLMAWRCDGNVGIGTHVPTAPLHVYNTEASVKFERHTSYASWMCFGFPSAVPSIQTSNNFQIKASSGWGADLYIKSDGNVGIGTTDPDTWNLRVVGSICSGAVICAYSTIQSNWCMKAPHFCATGNEGGFCATGNVGFCHDSSADGYLILDRLDGNKKNQILFRNGGSDNGCLYQCTGTRCLVYDGISDGFGVTASAGELLAITNDLSDVVFSANDVSGLPMIEATANGNVVVNRFRQGNLDVRGGIQGESDCYTKLLIHSDTNDGNTCFIDSSSSEHAITASGDVHHETTQKKFGSSSICFDTSGDYLTSPVHADFEFDGAFTIDAWVRFGTASAWNDFIASEYYYTVGYNGNFTFRVNTANNLQLAVYNGISSVIQLNGAAAVATNTWHHVAVTRDSSNLISIWLNGYLQTSVTNSITLNSTDNQITIGRADVGYSGTFSAGNSYIDELRISKGIARWTSNFLPPARPYSTVTSESFEEQDRLTTALTALNNGNVGIGNTTPVNALVVQNAEPTIKLVNSTTPNEFESGRIRFTEYDTTNMQGAFIHYDGSANKFHIGVHTNSDAVVGNDNNAITIVRSTGNVGIGTPTPTTALHVFGNDTLSGLPNITAQFSATGTGGLAIGDDNGTDPYIGLPVATDNFHIKTGGDNERLTIKAGGNVGINEVSPDAYLHVKGKVSYTTANLAEVSGLGFVRFQPMAASVRSLWIHNGGENMGLQGADDPTTDTTYDITLNAYGGNVGIGTASPTQGKLVLEASSGNVIQRIRDGSNNIVSIGHVDGSGGYLDMMNDAGTLTASIKTFGDSYLNGGKVGIGITGPSDHVHIQTDGTHGYALRVMNSGATNPYGMVVDNSGANSSDSAVVADFRVGSVSVFKIENSGNVTVAGHFAANTKSFDIPHPTKPDKRLVHGSLEGPEHGVYTRGQSCGCIVDLPDYWIGLVDPMSLTVQLTAKGKSQELWVECITEDTVYVGSNVEDPDYFYFIQAERRDANKLEVEPDVEVKNGE